MHELLLSLRRFLVSQPCLPMQEKICHFLILAFLGARKKFNTGWLRPKVQPLTLLCTIFGRKDAPFIYLTLTNGTTFVYLPLDYTTPFTYKLKQYSHKVCVRNTLMKGPFKYLNDRFPSLSYTSTCEIPTLSYT